MDCTISEACKDEYEIKIRSAQAKAAFNQLRSVLCNKKLSFQCRYRVLKCYVHPIYTYCSETWTISKVVQDKTLCFRKLVFATNAKDILDSQKEQCRSSENHLQTEKPAQWYQTTTIALPLSCHTEKGARSAITFRQTRWEESKRQTEDPLATTVSWKTEWHNTCGQRSRKMETLHKWGNQRLSTDMITEKEKEEESVSNVYLCYRLVFCLWGMTISDDIFFQAQIKQKINLFKIALYVISLMISSSLSFRQKFCH